MSATLHILNGDDTLHGFNQTGIGGDVLVWREVLSEGPLTEQMDAGFWKMRSAWICETFKDTPGNYMKWVVDELQKLNKNYSEINLWFEFDLHCQVNMLGAMHVLGQQTDLSEPNIFLICPDCYPGVENFRGMGQLNGTQLEDLFDQRINLTEYDFRLAAEAWQVYVTGDRNVLEQWINQTPFWGSLHLLKPAIQAQLKRLTINERGLNDVEQTLLEIYNNGATSRNEIYQAFSSQAKIYGMGNAELDIYLRKLTDKQLIRL